VPSSNNRQRALQAARAQRRAARMQQKQKREQTLVWITRGVIAAAIVGAFFWTVDVPKLFGSKGPVLSAATSQSSTSTSPTASPSTSSTPTTAQSTSSSARAATTAPTPASTPTFAPSASATHPVQSWTAAPPLSAGANANTMVLGLNAGVISIALDKGAKETVASMAFLARHKYFDATRCHRLTTSGIFVLQCGDPTATGSGGPGYTIPDENLPSADTSGVYVYPRGTVAMANTGAPHSGGSQFFLVYKDSPLPPKYTVWGRMTSGLDVLDRIAAGGTADGSTDGAPNPAIVISSATIH